ALGLATVAASSVVALGGTVTTFAISFALLVLGVSNLTVAGHAWIGHRVPFAARGRAIGAFEMSWAIALLGGAPVLAALIAGFGWRGPYVVLAIGAALAAAAVAARVAPGVPGARTAGDPRAPLPPTAWAPMFASAATAAARIGTLVE